MAARKSRGALKGTDKFRGTSHEAWAENVRERIRSSMLVNRLLDHALGLNDMKMSQIKAAEILMRKALPDLAVLELTSEVTHRYVLEMPARAVDGSGWQLAIEGQG